MNSPSRNLRSPLARAFGSLLAARIGAAALGFATTVAVARALGPQAFAPFALLIALLNIASGLVGPAFDTALVRYTARLGADSPEAQPYYRAVHRLKLGVAAALTLLGLAGAPYLAGLILRFNANAAPAWSVAAAFLGAAAITVWQTAQAAFQARQRFAVMGGLECAQAGLRLAFVICMLAAGVRAPEWLFTPHAFTPLMIAVAAFALLPGGLFRGPTSREARSEILQFTKWSLAACLSTAVAQRLDLLLLGFFRVAEAEVGQYAAAMTLTLAGELAILSLFNVLLPKASALKGGADMRAFLRRFQHLALGFSVALLPCIALTGPVARLVFGQAYATAGTLFGVLLLGVVFVLVCAPAGAVVYAVGRPRVIAALELLKLILIVAGGAVIVPQFGVFGMAWTMAAVKGTIGFATYWAARRSVD